MTPTVLPLLLGQGQIPRPAKMSLLLPAGGVTTTGAWKPTTPNALFVVTGPGETGVMATRSGKAGGTVIAMADVSQIESANWSVAAPDTTDSTSIIVGGATFLAHAGGAGGTASGGLINLSGGEGAPLPLASFSLAGDFRVGSPFGELGDFVPSKVLYSMTIPLPYSSPGDLVTTFPDDNTPDGARGSMPGGASFWGGGDSLAADATVFGAGGAATAAAQYKGGSGCILILEF